MDPNTCVTVHTIRGNGSSIWMSDRSGQWELDLAGGVCVIIVVSVRAQMIMEYFRW